MCNPNKKDDKKPEEGIKTPSKKGKMILIWSFRKEDIEIIFLPVEPEKPKEPEGPPPDPSVAPIVANKESIIEINTNNKALGLFVAGGKMYNQTPVDGAYVVYVYKDGAAHADKRLQPFDKITEIEGKKITAEMTYIDLKKIFKRRYLVVCVPPSNDLTILIIDNLNNFQFNFHRPN